MPTWTPPVTLTANTNENVNDLNAIITSLQAVLNGLDDANLSATAGIQESKLANGATGLAKGSFSAYRNAAQSPVTGTVVNFDTEEWDVSGWFDTATNVGRFTPQIAGYYSFSWAVRASAVQAADITWVATLAKNGALWKNGQVGFQRSATASVNSVGSAKAQANGTTDFFEVILSHNVGAGTAVTTGAVNTFFQGELIARS